MIRPTLFSALVLLALLACGGGQTVPAVPVHTSVSSAPSIDPARPVLAAQKIGVFPNATFGPRVRRRSDGSGVVVVGIKSDNAPRKWQSMTIDAAGKLHTESPHDLAEAPEESSAWDVTATAAGYMLAYSRPFDTRDQIIAATMGLDGAATAAPITVASGVNVAGVQLLPCDSGLALVWIERLAAPGAHEPIASVHGIVLDPQGQAKAPAQLLRDQVLSWQWAPVSSSQWVLAYTERSDDMHHPVSASLIALTAANTLSASTPVTLSKTGEYEVEAAVNGHMVTLAWDDQREGENHVWSSTLDATGPDLKITKQPMISVVPRGEQSLVALSSTKLGVAALVEDQRPRSVHSEGRRFEVVMLGDIANPSAPFVFSFPYTDNAVPDMWPIRDAKNELTDSVMLVTYGHPCLQKAEGGNVDCEADIVPYAVQLSLPALTIARSDVFSVPGDSPKFAMDLHCERARCDALVQGAAVYQAMIDVSSPPRQYTAPKWVFRESLVESGARTSSTGILGWEDTFSQLRAVRGPKKKGLAWLTYVSDASFVEQMEPAPTAPKPKKKHGNDAKPKKRVEAILRYQPLDDLGNADGDSALISDVAVSLAGFGVVQNAIDTFFAYGSRIDDDAQVFVTTVSTHKPTRITNVKGGVHDVNLVDLGNDEMLVTWVDSSKDNEVIVGTKLNKKGEKTGREFTLAGGKGGAISEVAVGRSGADKLLIAWADARNDVQHQLANLFFSEYSVSDLSKPLVDDQVLSKTKYHSHGITIATVGDGAMVGWIEDEPNAPEMSEYKGKKEWGAYYAKVDQSGKIALAATPVKLDSAITNGVARDIAIDCTVRCRLGLSYADPAGLSVLAAPSIDGVAKEVWSFSGNQAQEMSLVMLDSSFYHFEEWLTEAIDQQARVRRLSIAWP